MPTRWLSLPRSGLVSALLPWFVLTPCTLATDYVLVDLGTLGGSQSRAQAINNAGHIAGWSHDAAGQDRAFLYAEGVMTDLGTLGGTRSLGLDINDNDQVTGYSFVDGSSYHAFRWQAGTMTDLGALPGRTHSLGYGLSESGEVVGNSLSGGENHAFLWQGGALSDLGTLGGSQSEAKAINGSGTIVGWAHDPNGERHAFVYAGGVMSDLGTFGGRGSAALDVNDAGLVVGWARSVYAPNTKIRAFLLVNGQLISLGSYHDGTSRSYGINERGVIVGYAQVGYGGAPHAIIIEPEDTDGDGSPDLWFRAGATDDENELMVDLNDLMPPEAWPNWVLSEARGINDVGQIVGHGKLDGQTRAFLMTPVYDLALSAINPHWGEVVIDPDPNDPNAPAFLAGTTVSLSATPIEGKAFKHWQVYDPNHPGDANHVVYDANLTITLVMNDHREVTAQFECGSGVEPFVPVIALACLAVLSRRRLT